MIPAVLKNFNLFIDGKGYAGKCDVTPPKLTLKTDEHRAGGMDAPVKIDMGVEAIECQFTLYEYDADVLALWGLNDGDAVKLTLRGAIQQDSGLVIPVAIYVRGIMTEIDGGEWKAGEKSSMKCSVNCRYYRYEQNNIEIINIDIENMVRSIRGVDKLAQQRKALGL